MNDQGCGNFKRQLLPYLFGLIIRPLLRLISVTCRYEVRGLEQFKECASKEKCILMLWHNRLVLVSEILRQYASEYIYAAFISKSQDGDLLANIAESYTFGRTIRVPHDAKSKALRSMIIHLKKCNEIVIITPDGPKGPRYEVKPGITLAAKETQASVIPLSWTASRFWQLRSWDKLIIPKPFSKIIVEFGKTIHISKESGKSLEEDSIQLQQELTQIELSAYRQLFSGTNLWPQ